MLPKGREGSRSVRLCPCHDDRKASLSVNPGRIVRVVWNCGAECDPGDIRAELLAVALTNPALAATDCRNAHRRRECGSSPADPATVADAKRRQAIAKLPRDLNGKLYAHVHSGHHRGRRGLAADPLVLLGVNSDDFYGLADRAGIDAKYKYKLFKHWMANAA